MKIFRRILASTLVVSVAISCLGLTAFAATEENVVKYGEQGGYMAFGDSVARGMGATPNNYNETHNFYDRTVEGSYPYLLAQPVNCNIKDDARDKDSNFWPVCFHGMTIARVMDLLEIDDGYYDDVYLYGTHELKFGYNTIVDKLYGDAKENIAKAGLITIGFGLSDTFYRAVTVAQMNNTEINAEFVEDVVTNLYEGYNEWTTAYPLLLQYIKEVNPDATVVLVGNYNVGGDTCVSEDILIPVGTAAAAVTGYMNTYLKQWAKEYDCIYCDITNAETLASQEDLGLGAIMDSFRGEAGHLSPEGNAMVARNIINALPSEDSTSTVTEATTDIVVDLGRFTSVDSVVLDGKVLSKSEYSMDGYDLIIPNKSKQCKTLVVTATKDRKTSIYTYQLNYNKDTGYASYVIVGVNDVASTANTIKNTLKSIANKIVSLFKR